MQSVRDIKKVQIIDYLQQIKNQVLTFSEDHMIVNAMMQFTTCFDAFLAENDLDKNDISSLKTELRRYYLNDFATQYKKQNNEQVYGMDSIFNQLDGQTIALQYYYIKNNPNPLGSKDKLNLAKDKSAYTQIHSLYHPAIRNFLKKFGYYDIFLIHPDTGHIIYSVFKELDFATSLKKGPYSNTNFAEAFNKANASDSPTTVVFTDFKQYFPSYEAPAGFVASPIFQGPKKIGVLIFQFPIDNVNRIMNERSGMGETGESYLIGNDMLMRSDSYLDPKHHSVFASFKEPQKGKVETEASRAALNGETDIKIIMDYNGNPVLSAYTPIKFGTLHWALLAEIDKAEAFSAIKTLQQTAVIIFVMGVVGIVLLSLFVARKIAKPIQSVVDTLTDLSQGDGDLSVRLPVLAKDEMGQLSAKFNLFAEKINSIILDLVDNTEILDLSSNDLIEISDQMTNEADQVSTQANSVAASAEEMTTNMGSVAAAMEQASINVSQVASAVEEMTTTINEISMNAGKTSSITTQAVVEAESASKKINELGISAKDIGKIIETIQDISEMTNLLALNATIEAARAGESGKGFAVVANEIKSLAAQTAEASVDIRSKIESVQVISNQTIDEIKKVSSIITEGNEIVSNVAASVEEQTATANEISNNITQISSGFGEVNENVAQATAVAGQMAEDIAFVYQTSTIMLNDIKIATGSAYQLNEMATKMSQLTAQFKLSHDDRFRSNPIKMAHNKWKKKLSDFLAGRITLTSKDINSHHECEFGQWYFGEGQTQYGQLPIYKAINAQHEKIHVTAKEIVRLFQEGKMNKSKELYLTFEDVAKKFFDMLDQMETDLLEMSRK